MSVTTEIHPKVREISLISAAAFMFIVGPSPSVEWETTQIQDMVGVLVLAVMMPHD